MNANAPMHWNEDFDEPWRRLPWVILAALLSWILLLGAFAKMLERRPAPEPPPTTIEARIIELPPPVAGLQGGGSPAGGVPVTCSGGRASGASGASRAQASAGEAEASPSSRTQGQA